MILGLAANAQFVEEGTLESLYEARARAVLNSFLRPHEYTIVIAAEIDRDQQRIADYQEKMELQFIPGLPIPADPSMMPATNDLHSLKNRVTINLILNTDVSPEKESLIRTVLSSKLHLDEAAGDVIQISRTKFPDLEPPQKPVQPKVLPEFTWKTWALIVLLALLALAGLLFWVYGRRKEKEESKEDHRQMPLQVHPQIHMMPHERADEDEEGEDEETHVSEAAVLPSELPPPPPQYLDQSIDELKDQLLFLVSQYPLISSRAVSEMHGAGEDDVCRVFDYLTWDLSRKLFNGISPRVWGRLGSRVKNKRERLTVDDYKASFNTVYRAILAKFLESGADKDDVNPFSFVMRMKLNERKALLQGEPASTFAMIGLYSQGEDLQDLMDTAPVEMQDQITIEISKLQALPETVVSAMVGKLKDRWRKMKEAPSVFGDGPALAAKILRSYTPEKEIELYARMKTSDPVSADRVRRMIVLFDDLHMYPGEVVATALSFHDVDQLAKAFFNMDLNARGELLNLIPAKRAGMIERDLDSGSFYSSLAETATLRRAICLKVEELLRERNQTLEQVWNEIDARRSRPNLKAVS